MINKLKNSENILIILIVILGIMLRFYRLEANFSFSGELGQNLLEVKNYLIQGKIPLLGPQTSHPWLFFGPLYYWILTPFIMIFRYNPVSISYLGSISGILGIILNYIVVTKIVNKKTAIISSFLIAISPYFISFSRSGRFMFWESALFYLFMLCLFKIENKIYKYWFYLGLVYGIMLNFHLTPIALFPVIILFLLKRIQISEKLKMITKFIYGLFITMLPFLIYDSGNRFDMTRKLILWIPYRFFGFFGLIPQNNYSLDVLKKTIIQIYSFFLSTVVYEKSLIAVILSIFVIIEIVRNVRNRSYIYRIINYSLLFMILAFIVHSDPPSHYFVPILPIPIILISIALTKISEKFRSNLITFIFCFIILIVNLNYLFSENYYFINNLKVSENHSYVPYQLQEQAAKCIVNDAKGKPYSLRRIGTNQEFGGDFAQNYQYLLWLYGNEPVIVGENVISRNINPDFKYIINEYNDMFSNQNDVVCKNGGIIVSKTEIL